MNEITPGEGEDAGTESYHLDLLRRITEAGGAVAPVAEAMARHGYAYSALGDDAESHLSDLARRNYLEARFFDRVSLCPRCDSHRLNVREVCPSCRSAHLSSEGLLHHFRCGYVGIPSEFPLLSDDSYRCPKCNGKMRHLGVEFDRLGKAFLCRGCGVISENPPVEAICFACGARAPAENLISANVFSYVLTSRGAAAVRRGSLLDDGDEPLSIADAPVYRRAVILEFLAHEVKRLERLNGVFSLLLARRAPESIDHNVGNPLAQWLDRLRQCLREVDLIGQLGDALYVVILPQTRLREAEALRQRIVAQLGPNSPLTLSTAEISEQRHLTQLLSGLDDRGISS